MGKCTYVSISVTPQAYLAQLINLSLLAVSPEPPANMEDTYLQNNKAISTDKNLMSRTDEERSEDTFVDNNMFHSDSLRTHQIPNIGDMRFSCFQCDKVFNQSGCLKKHNLFHTGAKQFNCDQCGKTFLKSGNLRKHKLSHNGDNKFVCD